MTRTHSSSRRAARILRPIAAAVLVAAFAAAEPLPAPMPAPALLPTPQPYIQFTGGDGSTCARAVVIEGASHEVDGVRAQRWWVFTKHEGASIVAQTLSSDRGRDLETIEILEAGGARASVCFDITSFFGKP